MTMTGHDIRETFLKHFENQKHLRVASASLIPVGDPTLLLTNAGMVQFKHYFSGETEPPNRRLTSSQKSFRTVDIDEVGDATHLTMFEMLGNFSIGDYFKEGAIKYALECLNDAMGLPKDRFAITIHDTDDDAGELWQKAGIPPERIYKFGDDHNWWGPAGLEGPCGPCSELHYDFGADRGCGRSECGPNCDNLMTNGELCNRYVELWNLVFMQFYHQLDGTRPPLPAPSVDTGMGLERLAVVLQDAKDIYGTDLFTPVLDVVAQVSDRTYGENPQTSYAMRVVAEHARSASFLIGDGVVPGNDGRGYVLRRLVRRAIRHGRKLGLTENFMGQIADAVINHMSEPYPELRQQENFIKTVLELEEVRFQQVFQTGATFLNEALVEKATLPGKTIFKLWDTYGFPAEMTQEIAREQEITVDIEGFQKEMDSQRKRARASAKFGGDRSKIKLYESLGVGGVEFLGYRQLGTNSVVIGLIADGKVVSEVTKPQEVEIVLRETPFYPEGGGQVGDSGQISGTEGLIEVEDSQTVMKGLIVQFGKVKKGKISLGETIEAIVDPVRREDTARNHTATHLVHAALRQVLGTHVRQAGSLVAPDRLRFDFTHMKPVERDELQLVQHLVNEKLRQNARVIHSEDNYTTAIKRGALAFFGEKYEEQVRLVEIANGETFSFEVCGGTHVKQTGEVGGFHLLSEASIGSGIRRLEAVTGRAAEKMVWERFGREDKLAQTLNVSAADIESRVMRLLEENDTLKRQIESDSRQAAMQSAEGLLDLKQKIKGITVLTANVPDSDADRLRDMGDWLRNKLGSGVVVLGSVLNGRPTLVAMVTADLVSKGLDAAKIARGAAKTMKGGGGGRADVAQAGGKLPEKLDEALAKVPEFVKPASSG